MHHRSSSSSSFGASVDGPASSTSSAHKSSSTLMIPKSMSAGNCALATVSCAAVGGGGGVTVRGSPSQYVKLNVGGSLYYTTIGTLTKHDNMLRAMFSGRMEVLTDAEGWIMIDRCGKHFGTILNFLRDGYVCLPETSRELSELQVEAKYFCIDELAEAAEKSLKSLKDKEVDVVPICRVPLITSQKEEQALISGNSLKPIVKLLINRHNNKYSYTGASDDNILKNIELFDKLSLRFSNRVLFIKDVIGSNEICCWSFYGHGKKITEVCCTAIVYATDRKNTKVEFPEARIYEETLNCLLYENRNGPDQELMQATSARFHVTSHASDDEDDRYKLGAAAAAASGGGSGSGHGHGSGGGQQHSNSEMSRVSGLSRLRSSKNHN